MRRVGEHPQQSSESGGRGFVEGAREVQSSTGSGVTVEVATGNAETTLHEDWEVDDAAARPLRRSGGFATTSTRAFSAWSRVSRLCDIFEAGHR